jgi:diadenosine tetraphosphatase ApaH/serine/threonine PP2A family protein phosphatase
VLADIAVEAPDEIWCLGDVVGYGPSPNECCARTREAASLALVGNHDLAAIGALSTVDFSPLALRSAEWTAARLDPEHAAWLRGLSPQTAREGIELYHGSPRDPVWDYVLTEDAVLASFALTTAPVVLVGHSHVALALALDAAGAIDGGVAPDGTDVDLAAGRWLLNPGSVGQPRDQDPRAAWLLIDFDAGRAAFRRVPYPVERTQAEIRERGLPETLASRLAHGV